jgi:hypothetical protein
MSRPLYQSAESYQRTLQELECRVDAGVPLKYYDCEESGPKIRNARSAFATTASRTCRTGYTRAKATHARTMSGTSPLGVNLREPSQHCQRAAFISATSSKAPSGSANLRSSESAR